MSFADSFFTTKGVVVNITGLTKNYRTAAEEIHALRRVDFQVKPGEAIAIMGPSGCGKTTLLNLLGGVDRPTGGQINVDGGELTKANERALEKYRLMRVGFIFQFFNLIPSSSAFENIELPMIVAGVEESHCRERVLGLLERVGLKEEGPQAAGRAERQRATARFGLRRAGERSGIDPGGQTHAQSRLDQCFDDCEAALLIGCRLWENGSHGQS